MTETELEDFDKDFHSLLNDMADEIDPKESKNIFRREGLGKLLDLSILIRRGFQQSWQFIVIIQALWIFLGLSPQVSAALEQFGIYISGFWMGILAFGGIIFFAVLGMAMLLYGGSQRSKFLVNQKQNPAQRMDYHFYKAMAKWAERHERYHNALETNDLNHEKNQSTEEVH